MPRTVSKRRENCYEWSALKLVAHGRLNVTKSHRSTSRVALGNEARLLLNVLGPFELWLEAGQPVRLPKKAQAMLAFLAMERGRAVPRDQLATLLWGDSATEQSRQSLRQSLLIIRSTVGPLADDVLRVDNAAVTLVASDQLILDVVAFQTLRQSNGLADLQRASSLYRDDFLAGVNITIEPFERWMDLERQRLFAARLELLERLAFAQKRDGLADEAISTARRLVALDPLREEAHRLLMRFLADAGERNAALLQYDDCARVLRSELGIEPDADTTDLAQIIRSERALPAVPAVRKSGSAPRQVGSAALALPDKPSVAVLPFADLRKEHGQDYFVHGLMEDVTVALGREKWLFVIASPSASAAGDASSDPRDIGAKLGVRYLLRGSVRVNEGQVLFVVQLHDAARGEHIWSERFQDRLDNLFAVQNRLTSKVAAMIAPALVSVEVERAIHKPTGSLTALDLYLRALPLFRTSRSDNQEALGLLYKAIDLDPSYATAYALAARCFQFQRMFDWLPEDGSGLAEGARLARVAGEKGSNDSEALWMAGLALVHLSEEIDHPLAMIERSLALNPNSANAWIAACLMRSYLGDTDMAIDAFQRAQRLNPLDLSQHLHWNMIAWAYLGAGRYAEAADAADRTLHISPAYLPGLRLKVVTSALLGRSQETQDTLRRLLAAQPRCSIAWMRQFLAGPLQRNSKALEVYLAAARSAGVPES